ncbi:MAG: C40 family peptidase [Patescibacteria group bacterium]
MKYRAVGNRCAVDIPALKLPVPAEQALSILINKGFKIIEVDLLSLARECIGKSRYQRGVHPDLAPDVVDCSSFMKWLYAQRGIWLPRRSIQQRAMGQAVELEKISPGDLIFVSGWIDYFVDDPNDGVGHVGIATEAITVIHAANKRAGIIETPLNRFVGKSDFRGARRLIPKQRPVITLETPKQRCVETSDDIKWIVLQSLPLPVPKPS